MKLIFKIQYKQATKLFFTLLLIGSVFSSTTYAQENDQKKKVRLSLDYNNTNNITRQLVTIVKTKIGRSYRGVSNTEVYFYLNQKSESNLLGVSTSNNKGVAVLDISKAIAKIVDSTFTFTFITAIENNSDYLNKSKKITIQESKFELNLIEKDSSYTAQIMLSTSSPTQANLPLEDVNVKLYVERMFGDLLISEGHESTNENGVINFDFPSDLPGKEDGNLTIIAKLEDDDDYGTLVAKTDMAWGVPLIINEKLDERELWTARANTPIYLLVLINGMILGVWGSIAYIILQIFKIRKLGKLEKLTV